MKEIEIFINGFLNVPLGEISVALLIIIVTIIINKILISNIFKFLIRLVNTTKTPLDNNFIKAIENPMKLLVFFYGFYYALKVINLDGFNLSTLSTTKIIKIAVVIAICYFLYNLTLENSVLYTRMSKNKGNNTIIFPFISIIIRLMIIVIGVIIIANEFKFTGFIAGLGISGVAFALAAQDTFSNLFGGVVIVLDKPFAIGDWIQTSEIEGTIEEITFRSTKIRTFSMALATVPNSKLANCNIINWTQRDLRRIHFKFTISSETSIDKIKLVVEKIEDMLKQHSAVDNRGIISSFNELSSYGFGIFIYFYTNIMDYVRYEKLKQDINIKILEILKSEKVQLSFLSLNLESMENRSEYLEAKYTEIESLNNISEEERGI